MQNKKEEEYIKEQIENLRYIKKHEEKIRQMDGKTIKELSAYLKEKEEEAEKGYA